MGGDVWYVPRFPTGASFRFSMPLSRIIPTASDRREPIDTEPRGLGGGASTATPETDTVAAETPEGFL